MQIAVITDPTSRNNQRHPIGVPNLQAVVGRWGKVVQTEATDA